MRQGNRGKEAADGYVGQARLTECCCWRGAEYLVSIVTVSSRGEWRPQTGKKPDGEGG
jgi:hypothetical protein